MMKCFEQQRVSAAHVMVVGCGALGNEVLKNLVLLGVGHIVVVDFDVVEMGNLSRSILFLPSDAANKRLKVEVVAERLKAINPAVAYGRDHYPIIHPKFKRDFQLHFAVGLPF